MATVRRPDGHGGRTVTTETFGTMTVDLLALRDWLQACGVTSGHRWMDEAQPDLSPTFGCLATVGVGGDGNERPMEAAIEAVSSQVADGECNAGFVRPDALLIVTVISAVTRCSAPMPLSTMRREPRRAPATEMPTA